MLDRTEAEDENGSLASRFAFPSSPARTGFGKGTSMRCLRHRCIGLITLVVFGGLVVAGNGLHVLPAWQHGPMLAVEPACAHGDAVCGFRHACFGMECGEEGPSHVRGGEGEDCPTCSHCPICQFWTQSKLPAPPVSLSAVGLTVFHELGMQPQVARAITHSAFAARAPPVG